MHFPRGRRITRRRDFLRVRREGQSVAGRFLVLGYLYDPEAVETVKVGYLTTKKIGNAVVRARTRRRLRGILQRLGDRLKPGYWLVVIPRYTAPGVDSEALEKEWKYLARKAKLLVEE